MAADPHELPIDLPTEKVGEFETGPVEKLGLKHETEEELFSNLLESAEWTEEERQRITSAYELVKQAHSENEYRGQPYVYHLLRVANRIVRYMGVVDADVVVAALSHDVVEDHAEYVVGQGVSDPKEAQALALEKLANAHNPRTAQIIKAVTNEPELPGPELTEEKKHAKYVAKVEEATSTFEGWLVKFSDWCENGLGIIHSELPSDSGKLEHFMHKYGDEVFDIFTERFSQYKDQLPQAGANYVATQLTLGYQRFRLRMR